MKKLLIGLAAVPFLAGVAMAGQPPPLSDAQMDKVTAGFSHVFGNLFFSITCPEIRRPAGLLHSDNLLLSNDYRTGCPSARIPVMSAPIAMAVTGTYPTVLLLRISWSAFGQMSALVTSLWSARTPPV